MKQILKSYITDIQIRFESFLKKHKAYSRFLYNIDRADWKEGEYEYKEVIHDSPVAAITAAFEWDLSPERFEYWCRLNDLWYLEFNLE